MESVTILANNLITNALQHGGNLTVTCGVEGHEAVLTVQDDGPGIAETDLPHIFERSTAPTKPAPAPPATPASASASPSRRRLWRTMEGAFG